MLELITYITDMFNDIKIPWTNTLFYVQKKKLPKTCI